MKIVIVPVVAALLFLVRTQAGAESSRSRDPNRVVGYGQVRFNGAGPERWAQRYRRVQGALSDSRQRVALLRLELKKQRRILLSRPQVVEAIRLAATAYHVSFDKLYHRALCETGGSLNPNSKNRTSTASGLFQFLYPSTWNSTPFARESVWSPYANSMAAAWMEANGRGGEWVCR